MTALPNIDDNINELSGDKMNIIINTAATARHIHTFFVDLEYSIISSVVEDEGILFYNNIILL